MTSPATEVLCAPWAVSADVPQSVREALGEEVTDEMLDAELMVASEILWALSGRRWYGGGCEEDATLRSYPPQPGQGRWPYHASWPRCACWSAGTWLDGRLVPSFATYAGLHVSAPVAIRLPRNPVTEVTSVTVDGNPFAAWHLLRSGWLERTDGQGWHMCDDSTVVTYLFGEPPPVGGVRATVDLGVELVKGRYGIKGCKLPQRVTNVTRQGVSMTVLDPSEFLDKGRTGLVTVDLWLRAVNPEGNPQSGGVWSPDVPRTMRSMP